MKRIIFAAVLLCGAILLYAQAPSAESIMNSAKNRITSDTVSSRSRMEITARNGSTTDRVIVQFSKDGPHGTRTVIEFRTPANIAGTRFLTMDNASCGTDQIIFLPSVGRTRRIGASEGSGNFMGTDFSYDDISAMDREVALDTHTLLREEAVSGRACYVVQSVSRDASYQYSKTITWVDKENYVIYKSEMYNRRGELAKTMEMSDFKDIQGRLSPMQTKVSTIAAGTSTTIFMENMKYDDPIPEGVFTTAYLETGRVPR